MPRLEMTKVMNELMLAWMLTCVEKLKRMVMLHASRTFVAAMARGLAAGAGAGRDQLSQCSWSW